MIFSKDGNRLVARHQGERLMIEPWGPDSLRVRATRYMDYTGRDWALGEEVPDTGRRSVIEINEGSIPDGYTGGMIDKCATITNGRICAKINVAGVLSFFRDGRLILREYYRNYLGTESKESCCLKIVGRDYKPIIGGDYGLTVRFESNDSEKIFGMGQYQHPWRSPSNVSG